MRDKRYDDAAGLHVHVCADPKCGATWQHPKDSCYPGAHDCPRCGEYENLKAYLSEVTVIDYPWAINPHNPERRVTIRERIQKQGYVLVWQHEVTAAELERRQRAESHRHLADAVFGSRGRQRSPRHG